MKTLKFKLLTLLMASLMLSPFYSMAQRTNQAGNNSKMNAKCNFAIPNLSQDQERKITELRTAHMKEMLQIKNQLQEKKAHLNTLRTADKANMNEINKTVDEITALKGKMMKQREQMIQDVRKVLTNEQRVYFDAHGHKPYMKGNKKNCGRMNYGRAPMN